MAKKPKTDNSDLLGEDFDAAGGPEVVQPDPAPVVEPTAEAPAEPAAEITDSVLDAHLRRQASWEADAARIFKGPTQEQQERESLLVALSANDAARDKELRAAREAKEAAEAEEAKAARLKRAAELRAEAEILEKA